MFITGTAAGYIDLLEKVRNYLVNTAGWTQLEYDGTPSPSPGDDTDIVQLSLRAPGAITGQEYFINFKTEFDLSDGSYGWRMSAATDYEAAVDDITQQMASPFVYFNTWQNTITYWLYANERRFILVAKCNTSYISMYAGLFLPFALPTEYLKPFMLIGNSNQLEPYNTNNAGNQFIANPGFGSCYVLNLNGDDWMQFNNGARSAGQDVNIATETDGVIWPHRSLSQLGTGNSFNDDDWNHYGFFRVRPNLQGESPQFLCQVMSSLENHMMGTLDGVYATAGFGRTSEQELTLGPRSYRVFQNIFRTTPRDFMSVEEY